MTMPEHCPGRGPCEVAAFDRPEIVADPYDYYRALRAEASPTYDSTLGAWLVAKHADVAAVLRDPAFSVRGNARFLEMLPTATGEFDSLRRFFGTWLGFSDPPEHTRRRAAFSGKLSNRIVMAYSEVIQDAADHLVAKAAQLGGCDVVADFAPLPAVVMGRLLGIDYERLLSFRPWITDVATFMRTPTMDTAHRAQHAIEQWRGWLDDHLARSGTHGVIASLTEGGELTRAEVLALVASVVTGPPFRRFGENEPTAQFLAKAVNLLLEHPELLARLRADPGLIPAAVDELLRYEPPFHFITRQVDSPVRFRGVRIEPGQPVLVLLASANRDAAEFTAPDKIRLDRPGRHASFGFGAHFCLGAPLARLEVELTLATMLRGWPNIRRSADVRWRMESGVRALEGLSLELDEEPDHVRLLPEQREGVGDY
ncbi:cytochrome P450 [Nocardia sp. NPDC049149]|uniref:cytochrome P450 n=1 Tax=Nocardia sp. NPDC049149 TaxID=3364315 RepID=UPI003712A8D3